MNERPLLHPPLRLDDLFRGLIHLQPGNTLQLLCDLPPLGMNIGDIVARRLDTQLHDHRWLPDAAYVVHGSDEAWLIVVEGQSAAPRWPPARATRVLHALLNVVESTPPQCAARLLEVRLEQRHRLAGRRRPVGLVHFEPTNRLLDLDPLAAPFCDPEWWVFTGFSASATPTLIAERVHGLRTRSLEPGRETLFALALLLGLCGRVRFPGNTDVEEAVKELVMNQTQPLITFPGPGMTPEERAEFDVWMARVTAEFRERVRLRREDDARRAEDDARRAEEDARRAEEDARRAEEDARRAEEDARLRLAAEQLERAKASFDSQKADFERRREEVLRQAAELAVRAALVMVTEAELALRTARLDNPDAPCETQTAALANARVELELRQHELASLQASIE